MPQLPKNGLSSLSLFSGGGGLDLGFDLAGFHHVASYEIIPVCGDTLLGNRPSWQIFSGVNGDVRKADWRIYKGKVDVIHGGPPCQPFSIAGHRKGSEDERNMWPEFTRAVLEVMPRAFIAENVLGMIDTKFSQYIDQNVLTPLKQYRIVTFKLHAADFGIPQSRQRVFFVGFRDDVDYDRFEVPAPTHSFVHLQTKRRQSIKIQTSINFLDLFDDERDTKSRCMGVREALGLPDIGIDALAPTMRSGFTGPRNSTSIVNSAASVKLWEQLEIWPNGVGESREKAQLFVAKNGHFRLSVQDCAIIQGFPETWRFSGSVYKVLGQLGNSVSPPMAYSVATTVSRSLLR